MSCTALRFLVVEDQEFQRKALAQMLATWGAKAVYTADDGRSALQVIADPDRPVDIVISDVAMPGMDGVEFVRHLAEADASISLILTSAVDAALLAAIGNVADAYKVALLGVICKPPTAAKLAPLIEKHRSRSPVTARPEAPFTLDQIAQAWDNDEFEPWFEPKVDLATGVIRGCSGVPKWRRSDGSLMEMPSFMGSIHARGLGDDFAWLMVRKSAAECRKWRDQGHDVAVGVNLAFESLADVNLAPRLQRIAMAEGLDPRSMTLTVSESALNTGQARSLENLARLRVMGFGLGVDDFGSGSMAVDQLSRVAFTELKIGGDSLITGTGTGEAARAALAVGLELASLLKLRTVAGGIASSVEWDLVHAWGCSLGQGPFISAPLRPGAVVEWLAAWQLRQCADVAN